MSGGGGSSNKEAVRIQRESLEEQKRANAAQLAFMSQQTAALQKQRISPYRPMSPPPTPSTAGSDYARALQLQQATRMYGYNKTVRGGLRGA